MMCEYHLSRTDLISPNLLICEQCQSEKKLSKTYIMIDKSICLLNICSYVRFIKVISVQLYEDDPASDAFCQDVIKNGHLPTKL